MNDLTNKVFGKLTVKSRAGSNKEGRAMWLCECDCLNKTEAIVLGRDLTRGSTNSCGCEQGWVKHRQSRTRLYKIFDKMKARCYNIKHNSYKNYGGRGIEICDEWMEEDGFIKFFEWANNNGYEEHLTIDRIDVDKNYEPSNCRWLTHKEQQNNRRDNRPVKINGVTKNISEWSEETGINYKTLQFRVKSNWDESKLLDPPMKQLGRNC